jgi:hypothetical protein
MKPQKINTFTNERFEVGERSIEDVLYGNSVVESDNSVKFIQCKISKKVGEYYSSDLNSDIQIRKSLSCLLEPDVGDLVLCSYFNQVAYIVNILDRCEKSKISINFPGEIRLNSKKMQIETTEEMVMESKSYALRTKMHKIEAASISVNSSQYVRVTKGPDVVKADNIFIEAVYSLNTKAYRAIEKLSSIKKIIAEKILMG